MNINEFCHYVKGHILEYLPDEYAKADIWVDTTLKSNSVLLHGLTIRKEDSNISPKVYLDSFHKNYMDGISLGETMRNIANEYEKFSLDGQEFDVDSIKDFDKVKELITTRVVNAKQNKMLAAERPSTKVDDLLVFYQVSILNFAQGSANVPVTNELMKIWGVSTDDIHNLAVENTERLFPPVLTDMGSVFAGEKVNYLSDATYEPTDTLLVLSNAEISDGASVLANQGILERVSEVIQDDFYILPSSRHEVIIMPKETANNMQMTPKELGAMVREINAAEVDKEDRLSDHIYSFDRDKKILETCKESMPRTLDVER